MYKMSSDSTILLQTFYKFSFHFGGSLKYLGYDKNVDVMDEDLRQYTPQQDGGYFIYVPSLEELNGVLKEIIVDTEYRIALENAEAIWN